MGSGVVMLHAGVGDRRLWDYQWPWLTTRYRGVRCDLRGFGGTPLTGEPFSHAADVVELCASVGIERAVIVGGSLGGRVALDIAAAFPALVSGLVLVSPALTGWDWSAAVRSFGDAEDDAVARGDLDAAVELNLRMWFDGPSRSSREVDDDKRAAVGAMQLHAFELGRDAPDGADETLLVADLQSSLSSLHVPCDVMVGEHDVSDFHAIANVIADAVSDTPPTIVPHTHISRTTNVPTSSSPTSPPR